MTPLSAALAYARRGLRVLPIRPFAKVPLVEHGVHDASSDPNLIRRWFENHPTRNVGIAVPAHWIVVDCDPRNGGTLADLDLPGTLSARTGGGGTHLVYTRDPSEALRGKLRQGIDLLGPGRYFLAYPSLTEAPYLWTSRPGTLPVAAPGWLIDEARIPPEPLVREVPVPRFQRSDSRRPGALERARAYILRVPPAVSGQGGHAATFRIAQVLVRGFGLDDSEAFAILSEWNETCCPPWGRHDLIRKLKQAASVGRMEVGRYAD